MNHSLYRFRMKYEKEKDKMDFERNWSPEYPFWMSDVKYWLKYWVSGVSVGKYMEKLPKFMTKVAPNKYVKTNKNYGSGKVIPRDLPTTSFVIPDVDNYWENENKFWKVVQVANWPIKTLFEKL